MIALTVDSYILILTFLFFNIKNCVLEVSLWSENSYQCSKLLSGKDHKVYIFRNMQEIGLPVKMIL